VISTSSTKDTKANGNGFRLGFTLSNLGSKISYTSDASQKDYIPANIGLGAAYNKVLSMLITKSLSH
jgi:hypothetical protein